MPMRIGRTIPPAAAPIFPIDIVSGVVGFFQRRKRVVKFEEELKAHYHVSHCYTLSSGKAALTVILKALKEMSPGRDEVLIPAFGCYSVPSAIVRAGLKVRLCDLTPTNFDFDYECLSAILLNHGSKILCIVSIHFFGIPADIDRLKKSISDNNIFIVEDAAQAMGGEQNGRKLGTLGDAGFFSLGRGKALSTVEGGIILTNSHDIAEYIDRVINSIPDYSFPEIISLVIYALALLIFLFPSLFWLPKSLPFLRLGETIYDPDFRMRKMSSFQAGLAKDWERKLLLFRDIRLGNMHSLLDRLKGLCLCFSWLKREPLPCLIRLPLGIEDLSKREHLLKMSELMGLGIIGSYPDSIDSIQELNFDSHDQNFNISKKLSRSIITLPIHPYVNRNDICSITDLLTQANNL